MEMSCQALLSWCNRSSSVSWRDKREWTLVNANTVRVYLVTYSDIRVAESVSKMCVIYAHNSEYGLCCDQARRIDKNEEKTLENFI